MQDHTWFAKHLWLTTGTPNNAVRGAAALRTHASRRPLRACRLCALPLNQILVALRADLASLALCLALSDARRVFTPLLPFPPDVSAPQTVETFGPSFEFLRLGAFDATYRFMPAVTAHVLKVCVAGRAWVDIVSKKKSLACPR